MRLLFPPYVSEKSHMCPKIYFRVGKEVPFCYTIATNQSSQKEHITSQQHNL